MHFVLKYIYNNKTYTTSLKGDNNVSIDSIIDDNTINITLNPKNPITIVSSNVYIDYDYKRAKSIYCNGYQSWTDSFEYKTSQRVEKIHLLGRLVNNKYFLSKYGDYEFIKYSRLYSHTYTYINLGSSINLYGSNSEKNGYTIFRHYPLKKRLVIEKDVKGLTIVDTYNLYDVVSYIGARDFVFDTYFGEKKDAIKHRRLLKGYTSWYRHFDNITEKIILHDLDSITNSDISFNVFQIDDGYQEHVGDWLKINKEKFPNGLNDICAKIKANKLIPGIWMAPFAAEKESILFKEHPDWIAKDKKGRPVIAGCNWSTFYAIDIYNKDYQQYMKSVFSYYKNMGFKLFKLDFLYAACLPERKDKSRGQVMTEAMELLRKLLKDELILGCGVPLGPAFHLVDYCRIGCDASLSFDDKWYMHFIHRERVSTKRTMRNTLSRKHLDGRVFYNDPDVFILRDSKDVTLTEEEKRELFLINIKNGSVLFTSDDVSLYNDKQKELLNSLKDM